MFSRNSQITSQRHWGTSAPVRPTLDALAVSYRGIERANGSSLVPCFQKPSSLMPMGKVTLCEGDKLEAST